MLIPEVQTRVYKREGKKKLRAPPRADQRLVWFFNLAERLIFRKPGRALRVPGEGVIQILEKPVCQWQALLPGRWSWDGWGFQQRLLLRRKQGLTCFMFPFLRTRTPQCSDADV